MKYIKTKIVGILVCILFITAIALPATGNPSGDDVKLKHTWDCEKIYTIKATAEDNQVIISPEATFTVSITKTRVINTTFLFWLQNHLNLFPILKTLLHLIGLK